MRQKAFMNFRLLFFHHMYLDGREIPSTKTLENGPILPLTFLKHKLLSVPDRHQLIVQWFGLESKLFGSIDQVMVHLDKDTRAHLHELFLLLTWITDLKHSAPATNLVRLLKDCDRVVHRARRWWSLQKAVEIVRRRCAPCSCA